MKIVLADDNPADVYLAEESLRLQGIDFDLQVVDDGEQLLDLVNGLAASDAPLPDLILLDLNLPRYNGFEVFERLRACERTKNVQVIVFTSSDARADRDKANNLGARHYFRKTSDLDEFMTLGVTVRQVFAANT